MTPPKPVGAPPGKIKVEKNEVGLTRTLGCIDFMSVPEGILAWEEERHSPEFLISFVSLSRGLFLIDAVRLW